MKLLFIVNTPEFFLSHRLPLAVAARDEGFDVHVATGPGGKHNEIKSQGFEFHCLPISRSGANPWKELRTLFAFWRLIRCLKPDLLHLVTIKPVLYGGLVARLARVPAVLVAISGLGSAFVSSENSFKRVLFRYFIEFFYKLALRHPNLKAIFQNPNDKSLIMKLGALKTEQTTLLRGSGVSLDEYPFRSEPKDSLVITFASRLLREKGVVEFVEAARILKNKGMLINFWLVGAPDFGNPSSVKEVEIDSWQKDGLVEYLGFRTDIPDIFAHSNVIVLPSFYGEGLPKVLIEAAACGRAVVTSDFPGCKDAILPDQSGLLVPVRDAIKLANAIERLILDPELRESMGIAGRGLAENEFAIENIVNAHIDLYHELYEQSTLPQP